jgi:hypothetical protein
MLCLVTATKCFVCKLQPSGFNLPSADTRIRRDGPSSAARLQAPEQHGGHGLLGSTLRLCKGGSMARPPCYP